MSTTDGDLTPLLGKGAAVAKFQADPPIGGNAGLWWERYGGAWTSEKRSKDKTTQEFKIPREAWIRELADRVEKAGEVMKDRLAWHHRRRAALAGEFGVRFTATLSTPLVIGMGVPHPIDNGLMFHPTLGVPYIPGSSLKGAVQAFVYEWLLRGAYDIDDVAALKEGLKRIFGQPDRLPSSKKSHDKDATSRGSVIFLDALPVVWPRIGTQILNPHIGKYLTGKETLTDGIRPMPILFASVAPGCTFEFIVRRSPGALVSAAEGRADVALAAGWLAATLTDLGIGAKTKSGFGKFSDIRETPHPSL